MPIKRLNDTEFLMSGVMRGIYQPLNEKPDNDEPYADNRATIHFEMWLEQHKRTYSKVSAKQLEYDFWEYHIRDYADNTPAFKWLTDKGYDIGRVAETYNDMEGTILLRFRYQAEADAFMAYLRG